ncbi:transcriptional regulator Spx [Enterococcus dongliensis]|uniref:Transcriptional regulator Spx n=1 Tax=Enterococcus dongliensis TaxID=2559925 RepID=A0AAP5NJ04_9ENTE|nr:transcriptional regulator Spx [Enterococcus dongliensis]MDT2596633.1 transcriptional regulator Spx [Enterococcus dongliensis]MDT2604161.1 transcriptional regulator Spx [Enterococcus dongliensis]MDT2613496.1 transcriptional regulator Spx [Enterococcus dongliensis]MDT2634648.1 transcriptional regulator Spx [Enterococcus dongliensis]MDT2637528.1 transcriptional regulator Spx [Enterococcus dongliensis]
MIKLYISASCTSCRKAKAWLTENNLSFEERNIISDPLTKEEIKMILSMTKTGTDEIISTRSKVYEKLAIDFDELSFNELVELIEKYPNLLRRPLIFDETRFQVGYNEDEIHQFTPREIRKITSKNMAKFLLYLDMQKKSPA